VTTVFRVGRRTRLRVLMAAAVVVVCGAMGHAQASRPRAEVAPLIESDGVHPGTVALALRVSLPEGLHTQSNTPRDPNLIPTVLTIDPPAGVTVDEIVFPPSTDLKQAGQDQPLAVFEHVFVIGVRATLAKGVAPGELTLPAHLRYQACDANLCYPPTTAETTWVLHVVDSGVPVKPLNADLFNKIHFGQRHAGQANEGAATSNRTATETDSPEAIHAALDTFATLGSSGGYLPASDFLQFVRDAEAGVRPRPLFEGRGPLAILVIVFLGGLALNFTPCVLPMIPINLAIIGAGTRAGSRSRGFLLGGVYGAAMALAYGVLGLIVILTAGTFGTINASPWFNLGIAVLFVFLALAMFDVVTIDFTRFSNGIRVDESGRGTLAVAFGMGTVAALLAGACVAPVVIQVVLFSSNLYAAGTTAALGLPFLLGVGMAVPWPIAGAGIAALPKPGMWMVRVKQVLGVIILVTAAYYGYEAYSLFANRFVDPAAVRSTVERQLEAGWHASLTEGLATATRERKPVLIDMWATWCKNCLTMDKTTLADREVTAALDGFVKIKFQAEDPDQEPAKSVMKRFGAVGLPTYVILRPKE
jgi:thioredoxin:protein disulfide reductase